MDRRQLLKAAVTMPAALMAAGIPAPSTTFRKVERKVYGKWTPIEFEHLRQGDIMRFVDDPEKTMYCNGDPEPCPNYTDPPVPGNFMISLMPFSTNEVGRGTRMHPRPGDDTGERS